MSTPTFVTPTLYWSQTANAVQIKIDIKEADKSTIKVKVNMDGSGMTMGGKNVVIQAKSKSNRQRKGKLERLRAQTLQLQRISLTHYFHHPRLISTLNS